MAIVMISSELPEVLGMSDRVLVMNRGRIAARFDRAQATPDAVGAAMTRAAQERTLRDGRRHRPGGPDPPRPPACGWPRPTARSWWCSARSSCSWSVVGAVNPRFLASYNLNSIFAGNAYIAVAAIGMSMVIITGNIDVSVGALIGVLGDHRPARWPWTATRSGWPGACRSCWASLVDAVIGVLVAYARIPSIVVTLGMLSIFRGGLISATGGKWITGLPPAFRLAQARFFGRCPRRCTSWRC